MAADALKPGSLVLSHVSRAIGGVTNTGPTRACAVTRALRTNYVAVPYTVGRGGCSDDAGAGPARRPGGRPSLRAEEEPVPGIAARSRGSCVLIRRLRRPDVHVHVRAGHRAADRLADGTLRRGRATRGWSAGWGP